MSCIIIVGMELRNELMKQIKDFIKIETVENQYLQTIELYSMWKLLKDVKINIDCVVGISLNGIFCCNEGKPQPMVQKYEQCFNKFYRYKQKNQGIRLDTSFNKYLKLNYKY